MTATLLVLAGYLAAELLLGGYAAALAVFGLGLAEFSIVLAVRKRSHPSLILEGAVLAGTGALGEYLSRAGFPGAEFVLLELVLGGVLVVSTLMGRPWLESLMKRMAGFSAGPALAGDASIAMGAMFAVHGSFMGAFLLATGSIPVPQAILVFAVLYAAAVLWLRRRRRSRAERDTPRLTQGNDERWNLEMKGRRLGSMELRMAPAAAVDCVEIADDVEVHEFLEVMERYLKSRGCRAVRLTGWEWDELPLEIGGYTRTTAGWTKPV
ncbi:MAG: hypothetical protein JXA64_10355 [Candidatus Fermentibacteraceae bacterium]|nr:hypothetical protein [Candidatus Fermentibacteraceae bacterium]MBN2609503.1 hypothetical protein [Candidatus Fermentibacteraceae bacterium]